MLNQKPFGNSCDANNQTVETVYIRQQMCSVIFSRTHLPFRDDIHEKENRLVRRPSTALDRILHVVIWVNVNSLHKWKRGMFVRHKQMLE